MAIEWRTSLDEQLEAHLLGAEPPATEAQQSQTTASSTAPQGLDMGGFLARLRVYSSGWNMTGSGDHPCPMAIQADLDTGSCG